MNFIQHFEVIITAVKDVIRAWFIRNFNHNFRIVNGCFRDMKGYHLSFYGILPTKRLKTQVNSCRIESINITAKFENMISTLLSCLANQVVGMFFKDVIVSILVCSGQ